MKSRRPTGNINKVLKVVVRELQATRDRVEKLERRNRRRGVLLFIFMAILAVLVLIVVSPYKTITAKQFVVTGEKGEYRLILGPSALTLLDPNLVMRARLGLGVDGSPLLEFFSENEKKRSSFGWYDAHQPRISFYDTEERCRAFLGVNEEGRMIITLYDEAGKTIETFGLSPQCWIEELEAGGGVNATGTGDISSTTASSSPKNP